MLTVLTLLTSACSGPDKALAPTARPEIVAPEARVVVVSDADSGSPIALSPTQELVVRLPTPVIDGLDWSLVDLRPGGVLTASEPLFERGPRTADVPAGGETVWHLKPVAKGAAALRCESRRRRSLEPATQIVTYVVTVRSLDSVTSVIPTKDRR